MFVHNSSTKYHFHSNFNLDETFRKRFQDALVNNGFFYQKRSDVDKRCIEGIKFIIEKNTLERRIKVIINKKDIPKNLSYFDFYSKTAHLQNEMCMPMKIVQSKTEIHVDFFPGNYYFV